MNNKINVNDRLEKGIDAIEFEEDKEEEGKSFGHSIPSWLGFINFILFIGCMIYFSKQFQPLAVFLMYTFLSKNIEALRDFIKTTLD